MQEQFLKREDTGPNMYLASDAIDHCMPQRLNRIFHLITARIVLLMMMVRIAKHWAMASPSDITVAITSTHCKIINIRILLEWLSLGSMRINLMIFTRVSILSYPTLHPSIRFMRIFVIDLRHNMF